MKKLIYKGLTHEIYQVTEKGKGIEGNVTYYELYCPRTKKTEAQYSVLKYIWKLYLGKLQEAEIVLKALKNENYKKAAQEYQQVLKEMEKGE